MAPWTVVVLAVLLAVSRRARGKILLPPPRNVILVSEDFNLFLTWLPGADYPPGVFYTVQWTNVYRTWEDFLPCRNISETVCNITCASPHVYHSFDVRVKAQGSTGTISSAWVDLENIDYEVNVTLAPPALQVRKIGDTVVVNATFSDPLCLKDIFHDLTSDLEFWEAGANNRKKINMKNSKEFDAPVFSGSDYCFSARAVLNNVHSNFSEPICIQLHSKEEYEDEEEEEEDIGSSRPYTEMHRFQKNDIHSQMVGLGEKEPDSCSESDSSQLGEGSMPDQMMPGFFVLSNSVFGEVTSRFQWNEMTSLSAGFSSEESSVCPDIYPIAQRGGQEDLDEGTDFLFQVSDSNLPTRKLCMPSESFHEASCGILGNPQISLFGVQSNQEFYDLLLEDEELSENDSCGCGSPVVEFSPLKVPSREGLESSMLSRSRKSVEDSSPEHKSHGYQPRPVHYLSRTLQR
ncbi:PREDICTED: interferon lambda receptor 1 [Gekko japonicus]|uniref:Interferon lambda receptor 1 n=1 Tax=Gekko japonicus TaxID=146911 RepID=A0ABM1JHX5_GEKJA|nr:PREDICTED: interferon lambda receptor 1 [Gekko japonicus]